MRATPALFLNASAATTSIRAMARERGWDARTSQSQHCHAYEGNGQAAWIPSTDLRVKSKKNTAGGMSKRGAYYIREQERSEECGYPT